MARAQISNIGLTIAIVVLALLFYIIMHENAHSMVCQLYGGDPIIHIIPAYTECDHLEIDTQNSYFLAQSNVEGIGYSIFPIYMLLLMMYFKLVEQNWHTANIKKKK